ncbi:MULTISPECIES: STAS domain-containing protein [unclassified Streptomyces]|uniref:STAS domain-containing protein n=1 Tax=Streptomyces TaxID=1883 RepID=UPI0001C1898C|nr:MULTISPECIES: STAS domain-containing protein [unclassified Streptomyces]AEN12486.1 anti-sigma-factor antagonist [Streptomyces sp. SirexAA-E]MYR69876.1 anti-sigma factor antagonist [Streptomyces sp. SID4939]MYS00669.1 anti-sigma factor antagonist [Streptomyces sp. SID4940]MYT62974.1 anti-sigma factor antagonist [Streptomyces sp. SID8357]MYT88750.1 anti-sigma factor antagonist [Streptomyces sp. SID8360]
MTHGTNLLLTVRHPADSLAVVTVSGELDVDTAPELRTKATELIGQGCPHVVLDMAPVEFCDSSGLNALIAIVQHAHERGGSLSVAAAPDQLTRLLDMTGVGDLMPVHAHVDEAVAHLGRTATATEDTPDA